jgi:hypothetical protein
MLAGNAVDWAAVLTAIPLIRSTSSKALNLIIFAIIIHENQLKVQ